MACVETYATLRIFSADLLPNKIEEIIGISATESRPINIESRYRHEREYSYWSKSTKFESNSVKNIEHINILLSMLAGKNTALATLRELGCSTDIICYWVFNGQGGHFLDCNLMSKLATLGLDISWDVYFSGEDSLGQPG